MNAPLVHYDFDIVVQFSTESNSYELACEAVNELAEKFAKYGYTDVRLISGTLVDPAHDDEPNTSVNH